MVETLDIDIDTQLRALKPIVDRKIDKATAGLVACEALLDELALGFEAFLTVDETAPGPETEDDEVVGVGPVYTRVDLSYERGGDGRPHLYLTSARYDDSDEPTSQPAVYRVSSAPRTLRVLVTEGDLDSLKKKILVQAQELAASPE